MQGLLGVMRIYAKHAAILLAAGLLFQWAALHSAPKDSPKRPRITGIAAVQLYASNIGRSDDFYRQTLGLAASGGGCGGSPVPCFPVNAWQQVQLQLAPKPLPQNWLAEITFATDDLPAMRRFLEAQGLAPKESVATPGSPKHLQVLDPEGNTVGFAAPAAATDFTALPNQMSSRLIHAGFVVKDVAAENRFYVDVLGFKLYWQGGMKDDGLDWYELQVPDGDNWIEYMLNVPATANHKALGAQNHFSFGVPEIQAAADRLRKNGVEKIAGPGIGRDGKRGLNVYDPDDTRVEVTEFIPAREPCCHPYTAAHPQP